MTLGKNLPFMNIKGEKLKNKIKQYIDKKEFNLDKFYLYFCGPNFTLF